MCRLSGTIAALRHVAFAAPVILLSAILLQGCDHRGQNHGPMGTSLLQVPGSRRHEVAGSPPADAPATPPVTEAEADAPDIEDEAPLAVAAPMAVAAPRAMSSAAAKEVIKKHPDWGAELQEEDSREQDELKDEYQDMLGMDDPDQVDKAMKAAWHKMQQEDRGFTRAMTHTVKRIPREKLPESPPPTALAQRSDRLFAAFGSEKIADEVAHLRPKHHRLMLNQRRASTRRQPVAKAEAPKQLVAASAPPTEERMVLAALPSAATLDAEAASAEDAD